MPEPLLSIGIAASMAAAPALYARSSSAVSAEADSVRFNAAYIQSSLESSRFLFGWKAELLEQLEELRLEHSMPDWDGYGASPVKVAACLRTAQFIRSLPESLQTPELSVEPDGAISLDWMPSNLKTFSLSIGEGDRIAYAWVDGTDKGYAVTRATDGEIPVKLANQISDFLKNDFALRSA